ncbi:hypothetical protein [Alkalilimnicola ehrlichii]|uniref:hypothetical protein n=1 Tax=Alkalilimnicola ehrlichii TaxID=351052 RepID=UPI003B9F2BDD
MSGEKAKAAATQGANAALERIARARGKTVAEVRLDLERLAITDEVLFETTGRRYWQTQYVASHGAAAQTGRGDGGKATAERNKREAEETRREIVERFDKLTTIPERERAAVIARRMGLTARTVRAHLKKAERR